MEAPFFLLLGVVFSYTCTIKTIITVLCLINYTIQYDTRLLYIDTHNTMRSMHGIIIYLK